jgi:hypothetical protein
LAREHDYDGVYTPLAFRTKGWPKNSRRRWQRAARTIWFYLTPALGALAAALLIATVLHAAGLVQVTPLDRLHVRYGVLRSLFQGDAKKDASGKTSPAKSGGQDAPAADKKATDGKKATGDSAVGAKPGGGKK